MKKSDFQDELSRLFAEEDGQFTADEAAFAGKVDKRINRYVWRRRLLLSAAALVGGAVAGSQAPEILDGFGAYLGMEGISTGSAVREFSDMSINMIAGVAIAALSLFATFSSERI